MSKIQEALDKIRTGRSLQSEADAVAVSTAMQRRQSNSSLPAELRGAAGIARMEEDGLRSESELAEMRMLSHGLGNDRARNAMRELRTSVLQRLDGDKRILMVTGTADEAGGTFMARNLAAAIALDESKTALIIDCNLQQPEASLLALDDGKAGLREYLKDSRISAEDIIHRSGIPRLRVIPAGADVGEVREYFTSERLRQLLDELKRRYPERYIVIDAPPISEIADARILADVCDHVLLVVPFGKATTNQVIQSARAIGKDKFLGLVFNNKPGMPRMRW